MNNLPLIDYDSHPVYRDQQPSAETITEVFRDFLPIIARKFATISSNEGIFRSRITGHPEAKTDELAREGAVAVTVSSRDVARILKAAAPFELKLREHIASKRRSRLRFRDTQFVVHGETEVVPPHQELLKAIYGAVARAGAFDIANAYYPGHKAVMARTVYRINVEQQPFYDKPFGESDFPPPKTTGLHIDANGRPTVNGVLYLSPVTKTTGPFNNVTGSNLWGFDVEDRAIRKSFDDRIIRLSTERFLMSIPPVYRRRANFGADILDTDAMSQELLGLERTFTSEDGNLLLFDADGIHRGGNVLKGERVAIMFGIRIEPRARRALRQNPRGNSATLGGS